MTVSPASMSPRGEEIPLHGHRPWSPRTVLAPKTSGSSSTTLRVESNGSPGCYGGWELLYLPGERDQHFLFSVQVRHRELRQGRACLAAEALWTDAGGRRIDWAPIYRIKESQDGEWTTLIGRIANPSGATGLTIRLLLQWSDTGVVEWRNPTLVPTESPSPRRIRLGAVSSRPPRDASVTWEMNRERFLKVCLEAADQGVQLLCLPEVFLTDGVPASRGEGLYSRAFTVPGPEIQPFFDVARDRKMALCLCLFEQEGDLVYNTALLIDERGQPVDKYRKVHLALPGETWGGITPGDRFSVARIQTAHAKVGMNICMDSSAAESARSVAALGAEILLIPIMGDVRADGCSRGRVQFDLERWEMIQRVRALDNHLYVVAARNFGAGTGIFGPDGSTLAMDRGDTPLVWADVDLSHRTQSWTGITFEDILWSQRRPFTYTLEPDLRWE